MKQTIEWIQSVVIDLNLCPFAKHEMDNNSVRIEVSSAKNFEEGINDFMREIDHLNQNPSTGTTLLILPYFLNNFFDYLDFVALANKKIAQTGYQGVYQIATFHPTYRFHNTNKNDVTNYTNRSPYPMLHLLREEMIDRAITYYGSTDAIPENNVLRLRQIGLTAMAQRLKQCMRAL